MATLRAEEMWAGQCIEGALGVKVRQNDDGTADSMHDLAWTYADGRSAACEITSVVYGPAVALWRIIGKPARRIFPELAGGWVIQVPPEAKGKELLKRVPVLLAQLESLGVKELDTRTGNPGQVGMAEAQALQIRAARQSGTDYSGSVYFVLDLPYEQTVGWVSDTSDHLATWLGEWVSEVSRGDNVRKLARSGADETHLFLVHTGWSGTEFAITDVLFRDDAPLPGIEPSLPAGITSLWVASTWQAGTGFRWSAADGWQKFEKPSE